MVKWFSPGAELLIIELIEEILYFRHFHQRIHYISKLSRIDDSNCEIRYLQREVALEVQIYDFKFKNKHPQ